MTTDMYTTGSKTIIEPMAAISRVREMYRQSLSRAGQALADVYSNVMEEKITPEQAWTIAGFSISFALLFFPMGIILRIATIGWLAYNVNELKRNRIV